MVRGLCGVLMWQWMTVMLVMMVVVMTMLMNLIKPH